MNNIEEQSQEQVLTKKQRRFLKREQKDQKRLLLARRKKIKKIIFISLPIILIIGGIVFGLINSSKEELGGSPIIEISKKDYDAGTIQMKDGVISHIYEINNIGDGNLKINKIWTSCHCTTAILKVGNRTSPTFGMSGGSSFWMQEIGPGEKGYLEVFFDPAFHGPQGIGQAVRTVYLSTNDSKNKKVKIMLSANVVR